MSIARDSKGNLVLVGALDGSADLGTGLLTSKGQFNNVVVAKYDCTGKPLWVEQFGDGGPSGGEIASALAIAPNDDIVVAGSFDGGLDIGVDPLTAVGGADAFVFALDHDGKPRWARRFGGAQGDVAQTLGVDGKGQVVVAGYARDKVDLGGGLKGENGQTNLFVLELDAQGNHVWDSAFGQSGTVQLAVDGKGDILLAGQGGMLDFGGGQLAYPGSIFIAKLKGDGSHVFSKSFPDASSLTVTGASVDALGALAITGNFAVGPDFGQGQLNGVAGPGQKIGFVARFDANGTPVFSHSFLAPQDTILSGSIAYDAAGDVWIDGGFNGSIDFGLGALTSVGGSDVFLTRYDPSGTALSSRAFGGAGFDYAFALALDGTTPLVAGNYVLSFDFGTGALPFASGNGGPFLARLGP